MNKKIIIIGGGFAGLSAGVGLSGLGANVSILEQKTRLGGRAYSFKDPKTGDPVDNGQHAFMGCYEHTIEFLKTIGTLDKLRFDPSLKIDFFHPGGRRATLSCPNLPAPVNLLLGLLGYKNLGLKDKLRFLASAPRLSRGLNKNSGVLDGYSVADWLSELKQTPNSRRYFWDPLTLATLNDTPEDASAFLLAQVLKLALLGGKTDSRKGLSSVPLSDLYAEPSRDYITSRGGQVELSTTVKGLNLKGEEIKSVVLADGTEREADVFILAVPPYHVAKLLPPDHLEREFFRPIGQINYSPITSVHLWYDRPVLKSPYIGLLDTNFQWVYDRKEIIDEQGSNMVSLVLSHSVKLQEMSNDQIVEMADSELNSVYPNSKSANLVHAMVIHERKATPKLPPGSSQWRPKQKTPIKNLFLAGDWTDTELPATIESAVKSAHLCVEHIQELL